MKYFEGTDLSIKRKLRVSSSDPKVRLGMHVRMFIPEHFNAMWGMDLTVKQVKSLHRFLSRWLERHGDRP